MFTIDNIIDELKEIPPSRLEELYQLVHSLTPAAKRADITPKKIMSFAGSFSDMADEDYEGYVNQTRNVRASPPYKQTMKQSILDTDILSEFLRGK